MTLKSIVLTLVLSFTFFEGWASNLDEETKKFETTSRFALNNSATDLDSDEVSQLLPVYQTKYSLSLDNPAETALLTYLGFVSSWILFTFTADPPLSFGFRYGLTIPLCTFYIALTYINIKFRQL